MFMGPLSAINHLLNFVAPAFGVALLLALGAKVFWRKRPAAQGLLAQVAINSVVGCAVLTAGLVWFGRDGKMATYAVLVLACATVQWVLQRGWR